MRSRMLLLLFDFRKKTVEAALLLLLLLCVTSAAVFAETVRGRASDYKVGRIGYRYRTSHVADSALSVLLFSLTVSTLQHGCWS